MLNRNFLTKALQFGLNQVELTDEISPVKFLNGGRQMTVMVLRPNGPSASAKPVPPQPQPAATAAQPEPKVMLQNTAPDSSTPSDSNNPVTLEDALQVVESLREVFQNGLTTLKDLALKLKQLQREQKTNAKDLQSFRSTLRTLQSVKI
jgi:hypothetical protein